MNIPSPRCSTESSATPSGAGNGSDTELSSASSESEPAEPSLSPTDSETSLRKDLRASVADGACFSVMVGIGETYFPAFVLALGMGQIASGLIASVPLLMGAILQLISPWGVARLGSNRRWVVACVAMQAASFLPLISSAVAGSMSVLAVFATVSLYWGAGLAAGPAWNTWMETVVPFRVRAPFFASRTRLGQAGVLLGFLAGGISLQYGKHIGALLPAFAAIFAVAAVCRFFSARFLACQSEPVAVHSEQQGVPLGELLGRIRDGGSERMLLYFLAVQVAVQISGPYFSPFMLGQMRISYIEFVGLLATSFVAKILMLPFCGRLAAEFGARRLLWVGGIGIIPVSGLWLYAADSFWQLVAIQFVAGSVWAAYELAMFLLFFETVRREERTSILTLFNLGNAVALVIGALVGGGLLKFLGESRETYLVLFALSSFVRAATLIVLRMTPRESTLSVERPMPRLQPATVRTPIPATVAAPSK